MKTKAKNYKDKLLREKSKHSQILQSINENLTNLKSKLKKNWQYHFVKHGAIPLALFFYAMIVVLCRYYIYISPVLYEKHPKFYNAIALYPKDIAEKIIYVGMVILGFILFYVIWRKLKINTLFFRKRYKEGIHTEYEIQKNERSLFKREHEIKKIDTKLIIVEEVIEYGSGSEKLEEFINGTLEGALHDCGVYGHFSYAEDHIGFLKKLGYDTKRYEAIILWIKYYDTLRDYYAEEAIKLGYYATVADAYRWNRAGSMPSNTSSPSNGHGPLATATNCGMPHIDGSGM